MFKNQRPSHVNRDSLILKLELWRDSEWCKGNRVKSSKIQRSIDKIRFRYDEACQLYYIEFDKTNGYGYKHDSKITGKYITLNTIPIGICPEPRIIPISKEKEKSDILLKLDELEKRIAAPEGSVQEQPLKVTIEIENIGELTSLINDVTNKLDQIKNFKLKTNTK
jgi:hypothetical protein